MKKSSILIVVMVMLLMVNMITFAEEEEVEVEIPSFDVMINDELIDNGHNEFPMLTYKGVTYFPMTWNYSRALGLSSEWSNADGLEIGRLPENMKLDQDRSVSNNLGLKYTAKIANFKIKVNNKLVDNAMEDYPLLSYKNITYFPLTWRFAVSEFGWQYKWDNTKGLSISKASDIHVDTTDTITDPVIAGKVYGDKLFVSTLDSEMTIDKLRTIEKGEILFPFESDFSRFALTYYADVDDENINVRGEGDINFFRYKAFLDQPVIFTYVVGGFDFNIGYNDGPQFTEYTEYEMKSILDCLSMLLSNCYGRDSEEYTKVMQTVLDSVDGKNVQDFKLNEVDGHLNRRLTLYTNTFASPTIIRVQLIESPAPFDEVTEISEMAKFDDQFTTFAALNIGYDDLETDIRKYPEITATYKKDSGGVFYRYLPKYRDNLVYPDSYASRMYSLMIHSSDFGDFTQHYFIVGFGRSSYQGLRFEQYTNKEVLESINRASAYIYSESNPQVHKVVMKSLMNYLESVHLTPNEIPYKASEIRQESYTIKPTGLSEPLTGGFKFDYEVYSYAPAQTYYFLSLEEY